MSRAGGPGTRAGARTEARVEARTEARAGTRGEARTEARAEARAGHESAAGAAADAVVGSVARSTARDWAELLRLPALFTVPGDALAGAAAAGVRPNRRTLLALTSSLCLYEAGMALNDWADRVDDAVERPERPLPSGRIPPPAALAAAAALTATGLALASRAGRPALAVAGTLAGTVWAYDLGLKHTPAGPAAMAAARGLDLLLGATATAGPGDSARARHALPSAGALAAHTLAVTVVSRREAEGGSSAAPLAALAVTTALGRIVGGWPGSGSRPTGGGAGVADEARAGTSAGTRAGISADARTSIDAAPGTRTPSHAPRQALRAALALAYVGTAAKPLFHAVLNPSPPLTQRAVGGGIRAMIPLQAALAARAGAMGTALFTAALAPAARKFARKVSVT
ncbi:MULTISPECIES: SCO3242 family prenyltransferase [Streptomyces]|uniref:SCO3242 family prenyltransferase n=1 Tax=Streptomyces TaxID=1883 RepID=UPI001E30304F|nr:MULTISPECIES: UbiA family prenyltransferase [Streptomyces]UFQ19241.1 UbiA family prenyltransferase [Streptomyces huasconensis]WCL88860.1 UbiA family prenyltransferase [Streptomyces sp. JCM 35825]